MHGGKAPQVAAKREQRILVGEVALAGVPTQDRTPAEVLMAAMQDADSLLQKIKGQVVVDRNVDVRLLDALGEWVDRAARIAKTVIDGRVAERSQELLERESDAVARSFLPVLVWPVFEAMVSMGLTRAQRDVGAETFYALLRELLQSAEEDDYGRPIVSPPSLELPDLRAVPVHPEPAPTPFTRWAAWQSKPRPALTADISRDPTAPSTEEFM